MLEIQAGTLGRYRPMAFDSAGADAASEVEPAARCAADTAADSATQTTANIGAARDDFDLVALDAVALAFVSDVSGQPAALREPLKQLLALTHTCADERTAFVGQKSCESVIKTISGMPLENLLAFERNLGLHDGVANIGETIKAVRTLLEGDLAPPHSAPDPATSRDHACADARGWTANASPSPALSDAITCALVASLERGALGVPNAREAGRLLVNTAASVGIGIVVRKVLGIAIKEAYQFNDTAQSTRVALAFVPMVLALGLMAQDAHAHFVDTGRRADRAQVSRAILSILTFSAPAALAMAGRLGALADVSPNLMKTLLYVFTHDILQAVLPGDGVDARMSLGGLAIQTGIFIGVETLLGRSDNALAQRTLLTRPANLTAETWAGELGAELGHQAPAIAQAALFNIGAEVLQTFARPVLMKMLDFSLPPDPRAAMAGHAVAEVSQWVRLQSQLSIGAMLSMLVIGYMAAVEALADHLCPGDDAQKQRMQETLQAIGLAVVFPLANMAGEGISQRVQALRAGEPRGASLHVLV